MPDHVHMLLSVPPKYAVSQVMGFIQGKECDPHRAGVCRTAKKLRRAAFLGAWILGIDSREKRGSGASIHPRAGEPAVSEFVTSKQGINTLQGGGGGNGGGSP
jgi:hypothetical protein